MSLSLSSSLSKINKHINDVYCTTVPRNKPQPTNEPTKPVYMDKCQASSPKVQVASQQQELYYIPVCSDIMISYTEFLQMYSLWTCGFRLLSLNLEVNNRGYCRTRKPPEPTYPGGTVGLGPLTPVGAFDNIIIFLIL